MICIAVLTIILLHIAVAFSADCDASWVKVGSKCLWKSSTKVTRNENLRNCRKLGATLVSPRTQAENELIKKFIGNQPGWYWLSGYVYVKDGTKFIWMDGEEIKYSNWKRGQPNQMDSDKGACIQINGVTGWDDDTCDSKYMQMCEKNIITQTDSSIKTYAGVCEAPWVKVGSKCLWKSSTKVSRNENLRNCRNVGATLVSPRTHAENELIKKFIGDQPGWYWLSGYVYLKGGTKFIWMDGEEIKYGDWNPGQPNQLDSNSGACIQINGVTGWDDDTCNTKYMQLCEKNIITQTDSSIKTYAGVCEAPWVKVGSKCLWKSSTPVTRVENLRNCQFAGATLVSPRTHAENELIKTFIGNQAGWFWLSGQVQTKGSTKFIWIDGEEIKYGDWNPGQPNQLNSNSGACIQINGVTGWDDDNCDTKYMQMCEKNITSQTAADVNKCDLQKFEEKIKELRNQNEKQELVIKELSNEKEKQGITVKELTNRNEKEEKKIKSLQSELSNMSYKLVIVKKDG